MAFIRRKLSLAVALSMTLTGVVQAQDDETNNDLEESGEGPAEKEAVAAAH